MQVRPGDNDWCMAADEIAAAPLAGGAGCRLTAMAATV